MKIDVIPVYGKLPNSHLSGITAVVVDVLRTTTNIVVAIKNGAEKVIPTIDPGEAAMFRGKLGMDNSILAGEIDGLKINGFDIGNSPSEFGPDAVRGKNVIISTSNGTGAICGVASAKSTLIGAMINSEAVAKTAIEQSNDILIVCAGTDGKISIDDLCAAGAIASAVKNLSGGTVQPTDITMLCCLLYQDWLEGRVDITTTTSYSRLIAQGFSEDANFAFTQNLTDVVPVYENGVIQAI